MAAAVAWDYIDQMSLHAKQSEAYINESYATLDRLHWLAGALTLDSEPEVGAAPSPVRTGPVWAAYIASAEAMQPRMRAWKERENRRAASLAAEGV